MTLSRRAVLRSSFALGVWQLGGAWATPPGPPTAPTRSVALGLWLRFDAQGGVTALSNINELGQGTHTGVAQIVAEELDLALAQVQVAQAPVQAEYVSPWLENYATFGSLGLQLSLRELAPVCRAARQMLVQAAATRWQVAATDCRTRDGAVWHPDGEQQLAYPALLAEAARLAPPTDVQARPVASWRVLGQSVPRPDLPAKTDGSARFGLDAHRPGMWVAALMHAPRFGATLRQVDHAPALAVPGVHRVLHLPGPPAALVVVARGYWEAQQALQALKPHWSDAPALDSEQLRADLLQAVAQARGREFTPDYPQIQPEAVAQAMAQATRVLDLSYDVPFLAHATLEPMNAVAEVTDQGASLWLSTQSPLDTQRGVARALKLPPERVHIHAQLAGGGFGRRLEHGFAVEAALIAQAVGRPVQLIWSRETDLAAGGYRPAAAARLRWALDAQGYPTAMHAATAHASLLEHSGLTNGEARPALDWTTTMGLLHRDYALGPRQLNWTRVDAGVPCGYWRSVGASQNVFYMECTVDRAAALAGIDPLAYRLHLLAQAPQTQAMLRALAERAGWGQPLPPGHARGLALSAGNDARSAHVVHISLAGPGRFRIEQIHAVIDAGQAINPDAVQAQMMGGTLFGLSAALAGEVTFQHGQVQQTNFDTMPLVRLAQTPPLDVLVLSGGGEPRGVGEEGPASIAPAIANALFAATGQPIQRLPLSRTGWAVASSCYPAHP